MSATLTIPKAAALLGVSRNAAYATARRDGELVGVPLIRIGAWRLVVPQVPLLEVLGPDGPPNNGDGTETTT
jgi:hypothetical protein